MLLFSFHISRLNCQPHSRLSQMRVCRCWSLAWAHLEWILGRFLQFVSLHWRNRWMLQWDAWCCFHWFPKGLSLVRVFLYILSKVFTQIFLFVFATLIIFSFSTWRPFCHFQVCAILLWVGLIQVQCFSFSFAPFRSFN